MRFAVLVLVAGLILAAPSAPALSPDFETLGAQAFRAGYPLIAMAGWRDRALKSGSAVNRFHHGREMLSAFASANYPNTDTLDSWSWVDLSSGPATLSVPATGTRYFTLQFVSAWAETFAVLGREQLDGRATALYLTPPGWQGTPPPDARRVECPTSLLYVTLRLFVEAEGEIPRVRALQQQFSLSPAPAPKPAPAGTLEALGALLPANPPPPDLRPVFERMAPLGLSLERGFNATVLSADARQSVDAAIAFSRTDLPQFRRQPRRTPDGWILWDAGPARAASQDERMSRAEGGAEEFAALPDAELVYALCPVDVNGYPLRGDRRYVIRLDDETTPPVDGFWSLTVYTNRGRTVYGARQSIHSSTPNLHRAADGAIPITLGAYVPLAEQYNWLPLDPSEGVHIMLRLYRPRRSVFDGTWRMPAIVPLDQTPPR